MGKSRNCSSAAAKVVDQVSISAFGHVKAIRAGDSSVGLDLYLLLPVEALNSEPNCSLSQKAVNLSDFSEDLREIVSSENECAISLRRILDHFTHPPRDEDWNKFVASLSNFLRTSSKGTSISIATNASFHAAHGASYYQPKFYRYHQERL